MSGIGVVTNPASRRNRQNPRLMDQLACILGDQGSLAQPRDWAGMEEVARQFKARSIDVLCINGGDGTGHVVLSAMARVYGDTPLPMVALLRGGTMNTVAHGLGITGTPSALLDRVVQRYQGGAPFRTVERTLLCVDGRHWGFMFGNGVMTNFLRVYYEGGDASPTKAVKVLARGIASLPVRGALYRRLMEPIRAQVVLDGQGLDPVEFLAVGAATVDDLGFGFRPFYEAPSHPGQLHVVGLACTLTAVARELPRYWKGGPTRDPGILNRVGKHLLVSANRPIGYMVDGDFHQGGQVLDVRSDRTVRMVVG